MSDGTSSKSKSKTILFRILLEQIEKKKQQNKTVPEYVFFCYKNGEIDVSVALNISFLLLGNYFIPLIPFQNKTVISIQSNRHDGEH